MNSSSLLTGLAPVVDADCRLLILGSFPGVASLRAGQYYGHPRNHFWTLLGDLAGDNFSVLEYPARLARLRAHRMGIWDVIAACERVGSLDTAICNEQANDFAALFQACPHIERVAFNGAKAGRYGKMIAELGKDTVILPSSSPANAGWSLARKRQRWTALLGDLIAESAHA